MLKKTLILLAALVAITAQAENWKAHPRFIGASIQANIDIGPYVYNQVYYQLIRFDKQTATARTLSKTDGLNGVLVRNIYYNYDKHYLLVVYYDSNIDVLFDDGRVTNVPALSNMVFAGDKTVNDVAFHGDRIFLSMPFGFVAIDDNTFEMAYYRDYGKPIKAMAAAGNKLFALMGDSLYCCPSLKPEGLASFKSLMTVKNRETNSADKAVTLSSAKIYEMNDSCIIMGVSSTNDSTYIKRVTVHADGTHEVLQYGRFSAANAVNSIQRTPTGFLLNIPASNKYYYTITADGKTYKSVTAKGNGIFSCAPSGDGKVWGLGASGLFDNAEPTVYYKDNAIELAMPYWAAYNPQNGKLVLVNTANTAWEQSASTNGSVLTAYTYDGHSWGKNGCVWGDVKPIKNSSGWKPVFNPREEDTWYIGTWFTGVVKVRHDTVVAVYDERNSAVVGANNGYIRCIEGCLFDSQGNLWLTENDFKARYVEKPAMVLPADKLALDNDVTVDDWYAHDVPTNVGLASSPFKFSSMAIGRDDVKVFLPGSWGNNYLVFWRGSIDGEQESVKHVYMRDQDGNQFSISEGTQPSIYGDSTGIVWLAATTYLYRIDPTQAFDGGVLPVTQVRDSQGEAVLAGVAVTNIAVDHLNRKWVSTKTEGIYLLSPDGSEILKHFDASNSILPTNYVYSSCPMGDTGHVMIMTSQGVVEYIDIDDDIDGETTVTAFPNPVRPSYTGVVTLQGVKAGRTVRVTDLNGVEVAQFTAGTTATWDACTATGERVETGRYNIYVEQPDGTFTEVPQVTIAVIK